MTENAARLRDLHRPGDPLLLPNVWDAASAEIVQDAGFPALATASASIAAMLGYPDHEGAPVEEMFAAAGRVIRAASVPVTVDAEAGYGLPADELVERLLAIGAAGCNLEDTYAGTLAEPEKQAEYLAAVRAAAGDALVINARADTFIAKVADPVEAAIARGRLYIEAGADCVYPITAPPETVATLVKGIPGPVNVNGFPGSSLSDIADAGAARVSFGPVPYMRALDSLKDFAGRVLRREDPYA
ncbi:isocitrate lyase/PEP mutase family protein [Actinomadura violacea]|uniref:Isocitrate lyase/phosphoenolpyruvate mutase family protein n=1 Tax=Actinomadura violacea TaxID=2819934 RepID=A0ABS3S9Q9_9ACTN|nr:isocitrate lyase/phosphoenolpyruvate mutase family protein [Actinomadura violacea]MBO2465737.1 isocitrate lyase/phosphoenolpyruvate mutase family protein [Actinomadura violacea]